MKKSWIFVPVCITMLFVVFLAGFFLGRNSNHEPVQVQVGTKATASQSGSTTAPRPQGQPVNINTANLAELMTIPGIGEVLAQRIIDYRTEHGNFNSVANLTNVKGIGEKTLQSITQYITV